MSKPKLTRTERDIITLADLAPKSDVKAGAGKRVFGAEPVGGRKPDHRGADAASARRSKAHR